MQSSLDGLLHEATSIYRLVEFIESFCVEQKSSRSYVLATDQFFETVISLADQTKQHLARAAVNGTAREKREKRPFDGDWFTLQRQILHTIRGSWSIIHKYLKPAADAHSLQVPVPLVKLAEHQLRSVPGMGAASIAVLLTPELNYFQTSHTRLKTAMDALRGAIEAPPVSKVSKLVGFVELPFSQGPNFFTNIALYHELGHFVLAELCPQALGTSAENALRTVYGSRFTELSDDKQAGAKGWLTRWAEEIFCDLFAVRMIGPAFSFASMEVFNLIALPEEDKNKFLPSHPAIACRFREQFKLLQEDKWWQEVGSLPSDRRHQIERLAATKNDEFRIYLDRKKEAENQIAMEAFTSLLPEVHDLAKRLTPGPAEATACFVSERMEIQKCLSNGIVPSRLFAGKQLSSRLPSSQ